MNLVSLTLIFVSVALIVNNLEILVSYKQYQKDNIFDWGLLRYYNKLSLKKESSGIFTFLYAYPNFLILVFFNFALCVLLLCSSFYGILYPPLVFFIVIFSLLINERNGSGLDGADQMTSVILISMLIYSIAPDDKLIRTCCFLFIALQSALSYFTAGYYKLISPVWRDGSGLVGVMNTRSYGNRHIGTYLLKNKRIAQLFAWCIILFEVTFPLAFINTEFAYVYISLGLLFHLSNAYVMGLNNFLWAFSATYPAILLSVQSYSK